MRSNKINNVDLFTSAANEKFSKHIKTQSKQALEIINSKINWTKLLKPIGRNHFKDKTESFTSRQKNIRLIGNCKMLYTPKHL